jgi:hypothetical protein
MNHSVFGTVTTMMAREVDQLRAAAERAVSVAEAARVSYETAKSHADDAIRQWKMKAQLQQMLHATREHHNTLLK